MMVLHGWMVVAFWVAAIPFGLLEMLKAGIYGETVHDGQN